MNDYKQRILDELLELVPADGGVHPRARVRQTMRRVALAGAGLAVVALAVLFLGTRSGNPGVVARAAAAIERPEGTVLHYRLIGHRIVSDYIEVWQTTTADGRQLVRTIAQGTGPGNSRCLMESSIVLSFDQRSMVATSWHPATGVGYRSRVITMQPGETAFPDGFAEIRRHLDEGDLVETGRTEVDGRSAIRLAPKDPSGLPREGRFGDLTQKFVYYVDAETYRPLRWVVWDGQYYDVEAFEYLPPTAENLALVSVPGAHPGATIINGNPPRSSLTCGVG